MNRGEKKFLWLFAILFVTYVTVNVLAPDPIDWTVTFNPREKNPFGTYILKERSEDLFQSTFTVSNKTIAELDSLDNLLILAEVAEIAGADYRNLITQLDSGNHVFIGANRFSSALRDSLGFDVAFSFHVLNQNIFEAATSEVRLDDSTSYEYPYSLVSNYFILDRDSSEWVTLATLEGNPILIQRTFEGGQLTLSSTPYIFTNFGLLIDDNYPAAAHMLSVLPERPTHFSLFYQLGKGEVTTPLRYFLRQEALRWSLYLGLFCIIVFLVITSRRQQRPIPVVVPPKNTTVEYVKTLGALFFREKNHKKAAIKIVNYFLHELKSRYYLSVDYSERFYKLLSAKSGVEVNEVIKTFEMIMQVRDAPAINENTLIDLTKKIEQFK